MTGREYNLLFEQGEGGKKIGRGGREISKWWTISSSKHYGYSSRRVPADLVREARASRRRRRKKMSWKLLLYRGFS